MLELFNCDVVPRKLTYFNVFDAAITLPPLMGISKSFSVSLGLISTLKPTSIIEYSS